MKISVKNNVVKSIEGFNYKPFGDTLRCNSISRIGFIGNELDVENNYFLFGVRNYDKQTGRFLSVDPLWECFRNYTPYHYSFNNPISFKDPTGFAPEKEQNELQGKKKNNELQVCEPRWGNQPVVFSTAIYEIDNLLSQAVFELQMVGISNWEEFAVIQKEHDEASSGGSEDASSGSSGREGVTQSENGTYTSTTETSSDENNNEDDTSTQEQTYTDETNSNQSCGVLANDDIACDYDDQHSNNNSKSRGYGDYMSDYTVSPDLGSSFGLNKVVGIYGAFSVSGGISYTSRTNELFISVGINTAASQIGKISYWGYVELSVNNKLFDKQQIKMPKENVAANPGFFGNVIFSLPDNFYKVNFRITAGYTLEFSCGNFENHNTFKPVYLPIFQVEKK